MNGTLRAALIATERFTLEPLGVHHAAEMTEVLAGSALYKYIGGTAPTAQILAARYAAQALGTSPDGREIWLNWIIREQGRSIGFVQATVEADGPASDLAWVVGEAFQGRGAATEAARAMVAWLRLQHPPVRITASIHPENTASSAVARHLGLTPSGHLDADGEEQWNDSTPTP
ncbi:GNAT family N-acetyltransferase [Arthrobacter sp. zg-Y769]|uniref:GNAT family N-acetyltransferase n=1 Tax=Arthrobacter sp. zg-Y769 TaxID=2894191 RepID=UPI001E3E7F38|nr:GNAT family N-acetyltransferase [Arthrobacter sp. zg-Y769]MCC9205090.1 GNAT family N-acetyltransferase [Arthrobacter sp. zg-Y769]